MPTKYPKSNKTQRIKKTRRINNTVLVRRKHAMEYYRDSIIHLRQEKNKLQNEQKRLKNIIKAEKEKKSKKSFVNVEEINTEISTSEVDSSKELIQHLGITEQINGFEFSNLEVKVLEPENSDGDVLFKENYKADGVTENYKFKVEFITLEYSNSIKLIPCGLLMSNDYDDEEVQDVFNRSKRTESLLLLFNSLQLYAKLNKKRHDVLTRLLEDYPNIFEVHRDEETGYFIIKCVSESKEYFECVWKIKWWAELDHIMHAFIVSVSYKDNDFVEQSSPLFETLCSLRSLKEVDEKITIWNNIGILVTHFESKKYIQ